MIARSRNSGRPVRKPMTESSISDSVPMVLAARTRSNTLGPRTARTSAMARATSNPAAAAVNISVRPSCLALEAPHLPVHFAVDAAVRAVPGQAVHDELFRPDFDGD